MKKLSLILLFIFVILGGLVFLKNPLITTLDSSVSGIFWNNGQPRFASWEQIVSLLTQLASAKTAMIILFISVVFLAFKKRWLDLIYLLSTFIIFAGVALTILKPIFNRTRPTLQQAFWNIKDFKKETDLSFPSGHATSSMLLYGTIAIILIGWASRKSVKNLVGIMAGIIIMSIGLSRIYLGVHFPSDVVGGYLWGGFGLVLMYPLIYINVSKMLHLPKK